MLELLKKTLRSLNLKIESDVIKTHSGATVTIGKKKLVLPTHSQTVERNLNATLEDINNKVFYNPIFEDAVVPKLSPSLQKTVTLCETNLSFIVAAISLQLLRLATIKKSVGLPVELKLFLQEVAVGVRKGKNSVVNDNTVKLWESMMNDVITGQYRLINLFIKNRAKKEDKTYKKGLILTSPFLDFYEDSKMLPDKPNAKKSDAQFIVNTLKFVLDTHIEKRPFLVTNRPDSPGFFVLMSSYIMLAQELNFLLESVDFVGDEGEFDPIPLELEVQDLENLRFEKELFSTPKETVGGNQLYNGNQKTYKPTATTEKVTKMTMIDRIKAEARRNRAAISNTGGLYNPGVLSGLNPSVPPPFNPVLAHQEQLGQRRQQQSNPFQEPFPNSLGRRW